MKWRQKVRDDQGNEEGLGDSVRKKKKQNGIQREIYSGMLKIIYSWGKKELKSFWRWE